MVARMNHTVRVFMLAGMKQRNPAATPDMLRCMMAELVLWEELARKVFSYHAQ